VLDLNTIDGAAELIAWFGRWPSFHDAEVVSIELARSGPSRVSVHAFESAGNSVFRKHAVVTFVLSGLNVQELAGFNHQNVITGLSLERTTEGYELVFEPCHGVFGVLGAKSIRIEIAPGIPPDSQYK
jgi:hypothetical protein